MKSWQLAWRHGIQAGGVASVLSAAALALASSREAGSPFACLNATSHWLWGDEAARHQAASLRYTGTGYLIHHAASCFWGVIYERGFGEQIDRLAPPAQIGAGLAAAAFACLVDYRVVPHRLSPGFELRLSRRGIAAGYLAFGLGLGLAAMARAEAATRRERRQCSRKGGNQAGAETAGETTCAAAWPRR